MLQVMTRSNKKQRLPQGETNSEPQTVDCVGSKSNLKQIHLADVYSCTKCKGVLIAHKIGCGSRFSHSCCSSVCDLDEDCTFYE